MVHFEKDKHKSINGLTLNSKNNLLQNGALNPKAEASNKLENSNGLNNNNKIFFKNAWSNETLVNSEELNIDNDNDNEGHLEENEKKLLEQLKKLK